MDEFYRGWVKSQRRLSHPLAVRKSRCVLSKAQKQPQCTCKDKTVVGSSFTPPVALLVHPSGTTSQWTIMNLHGQINVACESKPGHPQLCHRSVWIVLECGFRVHKMDFSSCDIMPGFGKSSHIYY